MIVQKGLPGWRRWLTRARAILLHGRFGDCNAEFLECADNARGAPRGIGLPHVLDELAHCLGDTRSPRRALPASTSPVVPAPLLLPGNHGARLHQSYSLVPAGPQPREPGPEQAIGGPKLWLGDALFIDRDLMPQNDEFHVHGETRPEPGQEGCEEDRDDG